MKAGSGYVQREAERLGIIPARDIEPVSLVVLRGGSSDSEPAAAARHQDGTATQIWRLVLSQIWNARRRLAREAALVEHVHRQRNQTD
jgi:hypothetical protein